MMRSITGFAIASVCASLFAESTNAAQLFAEIERSTPEYEAAVEAAPGFLESSLSGFRLPAHRVVRFDLDAAARFTENMRNAPGSLGEVVDLSIFRFDCRISKTARSMAAPSGPGGWGANGLCEGSDVRFGVRSNLADSYFVVTLYREGGGVIAGLLLMKDIRFAVLFEQTDEDRNPPLSQDVPGGIDLLPGFTHQPLRGIDTRVGRILQEGGLTITYDIGNLAGNYATSHVRNPLWTREQLHGTGSVYTTLDANRSLYVTFVQGESFANFYGTVRGDEDIADFLAMVLDFSP
jgi:hypothetical protein